MKQIFYITLSLIFNTSAMTFTLTNTSGVSKVFSVYKDINIIDTPSKSRAKEVVDKIVLNHETAKVTFNTKINPSSPFCSELKGKEEIWKKEKDEYSVCIFEDDSVLKTWDLINLIRKNRKKQ